MNTVLGTCIRLEVNINELIFYMSINFIYIVVYVVTVDDVNYEATKSFAKEAEVAVAIEALCNLKPGIIILRHLNYDFNFSNYIFNFLLI